MRALAVLLLLSGSLHAEGFGHVTGRVVFDGPKPQLPPLVTRIGGVCGVFGDFPDRSLVVDAKGGIANVFVYLRNAPAAVHPELAAVPAKPATCRIEGMRYAPRALFVRAGQGVLVANADACRHNVHTNPIVNNAVNFLLEGKAKARLIELPKAEPAIPVSVRCDIHPWISGQWLVLDHPYAAITKPDGTFTVRNLPAGRHEFRVWHERSGWLEKSLVVNVAAGRTTELGDRKYAPEEFAK